MAIPVFLAKHPSLTKNEIRLFTYFHIDLSTKEIAALLNVDPGSVPPAKSRLAKKVAISGTEKLSEIFQLYNFS